MATHFWVRDTKQGQYAPVCTHCGKNDLKRCGHYVEKQRYQCRVCKRYSYGLPPDLRPKCPFCRSVMYDMRLKDGRSQYRCRDCRRTVQSEYGTQRPERGARHFPHRFSFWLNSLARKKLVDYVQATWCTDAQAVRAIFRNVLTGTVFPIVGTSPRRRAAFPASSAVTRNPEAAFLRFPNLSRESARQKLKNSGGLYRRGFQPTVLGVQRITVNLDDEAKEGLVYAMRRLEMNHADAARWLLTYAQIPERTKKR